MSAFVRFLGRLWPKRLLGQTVLLVLLALFIAQVVSALIVRGEAREFFRGAEARFIAERISSIAALMRDTPLTLQDRTAEAFSSRRFRVWVSETPAAPAAHERHETEHSAEIVRRIAAEMEIPPPLPIRIKVSESDDGEWHLPMRLPGDRTIGGKRELGPRILISLAVTPNRWVNAAIIERWPHGLIRPEVWIAFFVAAAAIAVVLFFALRRINRPLTRLSEAASRLGRGEHIDPLSEDGPADIRDATRAFNDMQTRLHRFIRDRTQMLAAISHDLRTPITSLRLRAEMIDDEETRDKMIATLEEMQRMTEAGLAFAREESVEEATRKTDIAALIASICDDFTDMGHEVTFTPTKYAPYPCRPTALGRALRNLIGNAATYGIRARVSMSGNGDQLEIVIDDDGPGIAPENMSRVFEPFVRLEESRNRETGGMGLGMAIARDIVVRHGGDIYLENRDGGGLRLTIHLPAAT